MPLWTDVVTPAELTGYARAAVDDFPANQVSLAQFLPNDLTDDVVARITSDANTGADTAQFRSYDAETPIGKRGGGSRKTFDLPPLGRKVRVSEYDQLRARNADSPESVRLVVEREAARQARATENRMEVARGQVLLTGKVTISENGFVAEADYGRDAGHSVTAGTAWSAGGAAPFADLDTWRATYLADNGENPGAVLFSRRIFSVLRGKLVGPGAVTNIAANAAVQAAFDDLGLGTIFIYDRAVRIGGTMTRVIPDDKLILLPAPVDRNSPDDTTLGATVWGRTLEASEPDYDIEPEDQPGIVAGAYKEDDPIGVWVKATAIGLPALANPNLSFVADVL
jgi:hypothetical protein